MELEGPLRTPVGLAQCKRASSPGKAGTSGFLSVSDSDRRVPAELGQESHTQITEWRGGDKSQHWRSPNTSSPKLPEHHPSYLPSPVCGHMAVLTPGACAWEHTKVASPTVSYRPPWRPEHRCARMFSSLLYLGAGVSSPPTGEGKLWPPAQGRVGR